jgi:hypothetical protein
MWGATGRLSPAYEAERPLLAKSESTGVANRPRYRLHTIDGDAIDGDTVCSVTVNVHPIRGERSHDE